MRGKELKELADQYARRVEAELVDAVGDDFPEPVLARLWAAEQLRRATEDHVGELLEQAHRGRNPDGYTWEELGAVLGMSPQGARQRTLRHRAAQEG